jgi:N-methylhydantoinase A/oxoprolinase/acetone carboxylase beta subunit
VGYVDGGLAIDGSQEAPIVEQQVVRECHAIKALDLTAVVIAGIFSPIDEVFRQEDNVREIVVRELPGVDIVCSHEVANIGFMERENASILNASILKYARRTVRSFRTALKRLKLACPLFLTQNDGTLLDAISTAKIPIRTFSSGATNSMRGAAYLAGLKSGRSSTIVVDIGGTSSDVGVLLPSSLPRQAPAYVTVAGISVNYSMPHLHSIGLGGGSIIREVHGKVHVGPDSVGHYLTTQAKVFGGETLTATDVRVAGGKVRIGDPEMVKGLNPNIVAQAEERIQSLLEEAIDVLKTSPDPLPVLLVGGGSVLAPSSLKGASEVIRPPFYEVANAVGAAISKVGGTVDIIQGVSNQTTEQAVEHATRLAVKRAVAAGAIESTVSIVEVESIPMQYITNQLRIIVKAVGDLNLGMKLEGIDGESEDEAEGPEYAEEHGVKLIDPPRIEAIDPLAYRPRVIINDSTGIPEWQISETDLNYLADGCYVLGCAGGGSTHSMKIMLRNQHREGYQMRVIDHSGLSHDAKIYCEHLWHDYYLHIVR